MFKTKEQHKVFAKEMVSGSSVRQAMITAGYSEKQANKGKKAISNKLLQALAAEGYKLADFGKQFTIEQLGQITLGRLAMNTVTGTDKGMMSAKTLGSHRLLNFWTPDNVAGVVILQAPQFAVENKASLLGEVVDNPSK